MPKWEDIRDDLFEAVMSVYPPLQKEQQERIIAMMRKRGHNMGWNAIRYVFLPCWQSVGIYRSSFPVWHQC